MFREKALGSLAPNSPRLLHKYIKERGRPKQSFLIGRSLRAVLGRVEQQGGAVLAHILDTGKEQKYRRAV